MRTQREAVEGALLGAVVGDALGVPVELQARAELAREPVTSMRGGGTWGQPAGTWSDDSSLLLCTAESLLRGFDTEDLGRRFVKWRRAECWTPWGRVFDIGGATSEALSRISEGIAAEQAGGTTERSNGNGSLMRILPVALHGAALPVPEMLDRIHRASAITHRHPRSCMACGLLALVVRRLLRGDPPEAAWADAKTKFTRWYGLDPWTAERPQFSLWLSADLVGLAESGIASQGYVMDTLTASLWCLLTSRSYSEAVLKAVNLGGDTDTTGCVTGGLAGLWYGSEAIPSEWIVALARTEEVRSLIRTFARMLFE